MTSKSYNITVRFTVPVSSPVAATRYVMEALDAASSLDQIPEWEIMSVEEAMEPDENYFTRINQGETTPT